MITDLCPIEPDWDGMVHNLRREGTPERVYYFEHGIADNVRDAIDARLGISETLHCTSGEYEWDRAAAIHQFLGHEHFRVFPPGARMRAASVYGEWEEASRGPISSWKEFEGFAWAKPEDADLSVLEYYEDTLPPNVRVYHVLDVWEVVRALFGFETFCYKLYEDLDLVEAVFDKVGTFGAAVAAALCDFECFGTLYLSDDLGYKTATMVSPADIRHLIIPWHKKLADIAHSHGKFVFFHSCGQMYELIDDYIDYVRIDAKHSFEDNVMPVTEVKRRYGDRLTLLGGVDVDLLARADEVTIRAKTREILDACIPGGGYFLGSGNWVTDYIPPDNYLTMLDEARRYTGIC